MRITISFIAFFLFIFVGCSQDNKGPKKTDKTAKSSQKKGTSVKEVNEIKELSMSNAQISKAKELIANTPNDKTEAIDAKKIYSTNCALCHGFKGDMKINGAKDLTKSLISLEESVAQVYFGKGLMKPYKNILKDEEIIAVCKYIETKLRK